MNTTLSPTTSEAGFAPDSAYASWGRVRRSTSDRMEDQYNAEARSGLALLAADRGHPVTGTTDVSDRMLSNLLKTYRRNLEDVLDGGLVGGASRARTLRAKIADIEREQARRAALTENWLADENGTHCYSAFEGRGGIAAVLHHGAAPPSYELAILLDWEHWKRGLVHVLDWAGA